jgi:hypothetical protein
VLTDRAYTALHPGERLQAALSATARRDLPELDKLIATCERKSYRMEDQDFMYPLRGFVKMAQEHRAELTWLLLGAMTVAAAYSEQDEEEAPPLDRLLGAIKGRLEAWDAFCRDLGLTDEEAERINAEISGDMVISLALDGLGIAEAEAEDMAALNYLAKLRAEWERLNA